MLFPFLLSVESSYVGEYWATEDSELPSSYDYECKSPPSLPPPPKHPSPFFAPLKIFLIKQWEVRVHNRTRSREVASTNR